MQNLWQALPASRRGGYAENSAALEAQVVPAIRAGDAVMVKGSLGSRMAPIVKALQRAYPRQDTRDSTIEATRSKARPRKVDAMLYWLVDLSDKLSVLNVFRYITFRTGGAIITALLFVFLFGPDIIGRLRAVAGQGPADPPRRPAIAHRRQGRHADHGRADDSFRHAGVDAAVGESGQSLCLGRAVGDARLRHGRLL